MHRGLVIAGGAALVVFVAAVFILQTRGPATPPRRVASEPDSPASAPAPSAPKPRRPESASEAPEPPAAPEPGPQPPGLQLGSEAGPEARAKAQAILEDALTELQRLDESQQSLARDVYMRGHAAAERVEDELAEDDEPARARLRADEDAMKAELRRIYGTKER